MSNSLPKVIHVYQNHHLDSTRWLRYVPRDDDIVITTAQKSGTTWVQTIVAHLILGSQAIENILALSPWLEFRPADSLELLEAQPHRRFIKSHLALDGLPFYPQVKYIVVGRDVRDVFMSLWNHYSNYTATLTALVNDTPGRVGAPFPPCPPSIHAFWHNWITRGWFAWESEGYPYWGTLHHTQTWWDYRTLPNILFVHFNDLLADLSGEIRRIATFLALECPVQRLAEIGQVVTFTAMKENAEHLLPSFKDAFQEGAQTFMFKGTNGRWQGVLSPEELVLYEAAVTRVLTPDCVRWLEQGRTALK